MSAHDPAATLSGVYVAARSESQLYQNICLSRYDAVSSAAGGWPVNGAPPFSLPDAGDGTAFLLSAPGAVRHDVSHLFFFNDPATTDIFTLSLHAGLPSLQHIA